MSAYHALAAPMSKEAALPLRAIGRSLVSRGFWGTAARGGEVLASQGGNAGRVGKFITPGARAMQKASPWMAGYGVAGMAAEPLGYDLPGSHLAFNVGAPGWGALFSAPGAIRSARLATGKYDDAIAQDAMLGAREAGQHWITATQRDGRTAHDPNAYIEFLRANNIDTSSADQYFSGQPPQRPGLWHRMGNVFENPTGNVLPEVRQRIYDQMYKGASASTMEKQAWAAAARGAWNLSRAAGGNVLSSAFRAGRSGVQSSAPGMFMARHPAIGRWGGRALTAGMAATPVIDGYDAITSEKPYDELAVQQEGYDGGQAAIRHGLGGMTPFQRRMAMLDPSLAVNALEGRLPGSIAAWEAANGTAYQPGFIGGIQQAWQRRGTPEFYSYDAAGTPRYL